MRQSEIKRKTNETDIELKLDLDGRGESDISTGCGFLDHMLTLFARHGRFDLTIKCKGDTEVDYHHTVEDIGIALGQAFSDALGMKYGINRYGFMILPMDEALILTSVDLSGRDYLGFDLQIPTEKVGDFDTELVKEFFFAFVRNSGAVLANLTLKDKSICGEFIQASYRSSAAVLGIALVKNIYGSTGLAPLMVVSVVPFYNAFKYWKPIMDEELRKEKENKEIHNSVQKA